MKYCLFAISHLCCMRFIVQSLLNVVIDAATADRSVQQLSMHLLNSAVINDKMQQTDEYKIQAFMLHQTNTEKDCPICFNRPVSHITAMTVAARLEGTVP